jgi:tetratricopeptide (TPR) repeat protein
LGVNVVIDATLHDNGQSIGVALSIYDATLSRVVENGELTGNRSNLLDLSDQVYEFTTKHLRLVQAEGSFRAGMRAVGSNESYDLYLKAVSADLNERGASDLENAIRLYQAAIAVEPTFALAYLGSARSNLYLYRDNKSSVALQKALAACNQAVQLLDDFADVHIVLSAIYAETKNKNGSIAEARRAVDLASNSDEAYRQLGDAYTGNGQNNDAIAAYKNAVAANPHFWVNHNALGKAYMEQGDTTKAAPEFQKVTELASENPIGYENMGLTLIRNSQWSEAIPYFQKALVIAPSSVTYSNLGTSFYFLKRYD